jgi:transposase-like protein
MTRTYKRNSTYSLWTEDEMKNTANIVMRANVSIRVASGLIEVPHNTIQNLVEAPGLQPKFQNNTPE